jgi:two-component system cell cycle response regulator DivK
VTNLLAFVIEDDPGLADIFSHALRAASFQVEIIRDGQTAQTRLANVTPALVVLDLHLPHVSGKTLLRQIRADERLTKTQVIVTTADALTAAQVDEEADVVLLKPVSVIQLRDLAMRLRPTYDKDGVDKRQPNQ